MYTVTFDESVPVGVKELSTADGIALTPKDYIIIDNHKAGGVALSAINRDTIDIIDVVDDIYVKRSEYDKTTGELSDAIDSAVSTASSENENLSTNLTKYVDGKINGLDFPKTNLSGSLVLSSISQTDGKISVETRKLSIDELENADSFVGDKITNNNKTLSCENSLPANTKYLITSLSQDNGKIGYTTEKLEISSIPDLTDRLTGLSTVDVNLGNKLSSVGLVVAGMNNALSTLYNDISACFYIDDNGLKRQKTYSEVDFDDTISVCFQLMKKLDDMFNPNASINLYQSYVEALSVMNIKYY